MVEIKGKQKRKIRTVLKTRPVDLKIGKRGLTPEFLRECAKILGRDFMIKLGLPCLLYTSPSPRDQRGSRMPSSA